MGYKEELNRIVGAKEAMRQAIINKGVDMPEDTKLAQFPEYIGLISGGVADPTGDGTLADLKLALSTDNPAEYYPIGTEFEDKWDGVDNPWIVGHYQVVDGKYRVGLTRKFIQPDQQIFGQTVDYATSYALSYLNTTYLEKCSQAIKDVISEVTVPTSDGSSILQVPGKIHLPSGVEAGFTYNTGEGEFWELWKQRTGWSSPSNGNNAGRQIHRLVNGNDNGVWIWWLRSRGSATYSCAVPQGGDIASYYSPNSNYGYLPIAYITED